MSQNLFYTYKTESTQYHTYKNESLTHLYMYKIEGDRYFYKMSDSYQSKV